MVPIPHSIRPTRAIALPNHRIDAQQPPLRHALQLRDELGGEGDPRRHGNRIDALDGGGEGGREALERDAVALNAEGLVGEGGEGIVGDEVGDEGWVGG